MCIEGVKNRFRLLNSIATRGVSLCRCTEALMFAGPRDTQHFFRPVLLKYIDEAKSNSFFVRLSQEQVLTPGQVVDQRYFYLLEDRTVSKERTTRLVETTTVEKEYVTKVKPIREHLKPKYIESLSTEVLILNEENPRQLDGHRAGDDRVRPTQPESRLEKSSQNQRHNDMMRAEGPEGAVHPSEANQLPAAAATQQTNFSAGSKTVYHLFKSFLGNRRRHSSKDASPVLHVKDSGPKRTSKHKVTCAQWLFKKNHNHSHSKADGSPTSQLTQKKGEPSALKEGDGLTTSADTASNQIQKGVTSSARKHCDENVVKHGCQGQGHGEDYEQISYFTRLEEHKIFKEKVERVVEHYLYQLEYVLQVKYTGEKSGKPTRELLSQDRYLLHPSG